MVRFGIYVSFVSTTSSVDSISIAGVNLQAVLDIATLNSGLSTISITDGMFAYGITCCYTSSAYTISNIGGMSAYDKSYSEFC